jgi:hypothetical protein
VLKDEQLSFPFLDPYRGEIKAFSEKVHARILDPLLRLFSLLLELPETYLADPHAYHKASEDHLRYVRFRLLLSFLFSSLTLLYTDELLSSQR